MKNSRTIRTIISFVFITAMLLNGLSAAAISSDRTLSKYTPHVSDDVLDGYSWGDITTMGTTGFNYALLTPYNNTEIYFGFDSRMSGKDSYYNALFDISAGWRIKIPYIEFSNREMYLQTGREGYKYQISSKPVDNENSDIKQYTINDYPGSYSLTQRYIDGESLYLLEKPYGNQEYYSLDGKIIKTVDPFSNTTEYFYEDGVISEIVYPDKSSVYFEREDYTFSVKYKKDSEIKTLAMLYLEDYSENVKVVSSIEDSNGDKAKIEYIVLKNSDCLLVSSYTVDTAYDDKFTCTFKYEADSPRAESLTTLYDVDGSAKTKQYYYGSDGRMSKMVYSDNLVEVYTYSQSEDGSLTVEEVQTSDGEQYISSKTLNIYGQVTHYSFYDGKLELRYDENNSLVAEIEDEVRPFTHTYTKQGLIKATSFPTGEKTTYEYYSDGTIKKKTTNAKEIYYSQNGRIEKEIIDGQTYIYDVNNKPDDTASLMVVGVKSYDIDSQVYATNFTYYYSNTYNCYAYAINKYDSSCGPGDFCGNSGVTPASTYDAKLLVFQDLQNKFANKTIADSSVGAAISASSWKIVLATKSGDASNYHFMKEEYDTSTKPTIWRFKFADYGPVMQLMPNKYPSSATGYTGISWDTYYAPYGDYVVQTSSYYNSSARYYIKIS